MRRMMLVQGALLLSAIAHLSAAQNSCECVAYFYCNSTQSENDKCGDYEVCCDLGGETIPTSPSFTPTSTQIPVVDPQRGTICGLRGKPKQDIGDIIEWRIPDDKANTSTKFGEFPWMVAVLKITPSGAQEFLSGGSVIYPNIILTSAHQLSGLKSEDLRVKAGIWNTTDVEETSLHQDRRVSQIVVHSGFNKAKVANDVALLVLSESLTITNNVAPVCLPDPKRVVNMSSCLATGWGADNFGKKVRNTLRKVDLPLVDARTCQSKLREVERLGPQFKLHDSFLCAGGGEADTCTGDGGGPLVCATLSDPAKYVQVGITSWGIGCGQRIPGVYSSVEVAANWIETLVDAFPDARSPPALGSFLRPSK